MPLDLNHWESDVFGSLMSLPDIASQIQDTNMAIRELVAVLRDDLDDDPPLEAPPFWAVPMGYATHGVIMPGVEVRMVREDDLREYVPKVIRWARRQPNPLEVPGAQITIQGTIADVVTMFGIEGVDTGIATVMATKIMAALEANAEGRD